MLEHIEIEWLGWMWNESKNADKVYAVIRVRSHNKHFKIWGRRGQKPTIEIYRNDKDYDIISEKMRKGYKTQVYPIVSDFFDLECLRDRLIVQLLSV